MISENIQQEIDKIFAGDENHRSLEICISKDRGGFHYSVHFGGYVRPYDKHHPDHSLVVGSGESRDNLDDAFAKALEKSRSLL